MTHRTRIALLVAAGLTLSSAAFAQDAGDAAEMSQAEAEAMAELLATPSTRGVVTDRETCLAEGGDIHDLQDGTACGIPIRGEAAASAYYDDKVEGVIRCEGNGPFANEVSASNPDYCMVYLTEKVRPKTLEEMQAEVDAMNAAAEAEAGVVTDEADTPSGE